MAATFGEQLRLAREARGISLREISEQTRISTRYLEAIENGDLKRLPGGIFNRSFIKAYAKYVGFDEEEALEAYARTAREQGAPEEVATTPYHSRVYTDGSGTRSPLVTLLLTVLILAILSLGVYAVYHWYERRQEANRTPPAPQPAAQPATNNAAGADNATATNEFVIQLRAVSEPVWVSALVDGKTPSGPERTLEPGETREYRPAQSLSIKYAKTKAPALSVTINGRSAKVASESSGNLVEMVIAKDDYEKFLQ